MCASRRQRRPLRGALILALAVAIALLVFFLDDLIRAARPTYSLVVTYPAAPRLVTGAPVWLAGRPVGTITRIELLPPTDAHRDRIAVTIRIARAVQPFVRTDSPARLTTPGLLEDPIIDIYPGSPDAPVLRPGDTIRGTPLPELDSLADKALAFGRAFDSLLAGVRVLDTLADQRRGALLDLRTQLTLARFQIDRLARQLEEGTLGPIARDSALRADLSQIFRKFNEMGRRLGEIAADSGATGQTRPGPALHELAQSVRELRSSIADLEAIVSGPDGFLPRLARDSALFHAIAATRAALDSLIAVSRRNPLRYLF